MKLTTRKLESLYADAAWDMAGDRDVWRAQRTIAGQAVRVQIPLGGHDQTLSETRVYDVVSDKVRGLCLVV